MTAHAVYQKHPWMFGSEPHSDAKNSISTIISAHLSIYTSILSVYEALGLPFCSPSLKTIVFALKSVWRIFRISSLQFHCRFCVCLCRSNRNLVSGFSTHTHAYCTLCLFHCIENSYHRKYIPLCSAHCNLFATNRFYSQITHAFSPFQWNRNLEFIICDNEHHEITTTRTARILAFYSFWEDDVIFNYKN